MKNHYLALLSVIFFSLSSFFALSNTIQAEEQIDYGISVPDVPDGEKSSYTVTYLDKEEKSFAIDGDDSMVESSVYTIRRYRENGRDFYEAREIENLGRGMYNDFSTVFENTSYMKMVRYSEEFYSYTGNKIRFHTTNYDDEFLSFPHPTITPHILTFWLRGMEFKEGHKATFYIRLLGDTAQPFRIYAVVGKPEDIHVPAGAFTCYKVTIVPDLKQILGKWKWASFIISPLIPDFFLWYDVNPPHKMIRFEGALGVKGITAVQIHELTDYSIPQKGFPQ